MNEKTNTTLERKAIIFNDFPVYEPQYGQLIIHPKRKKLDWKFSKKELASSTRKDEILEALDMIKLNTKVINFTNTRIKTMKSELEIYKRDNKPLNWAIWKPEINKIYKEEMKVYEGYISRRMTRIKKYRMKVKALKGKNKTIKQNLHDHKMDLGLI